MAYGGFGGGNMQQLMKQAQAMQRKLQEAQQELAESEVTGSAAGGMVEVTLTGDKTPVSVSIKPEAVDPDDSQRRNEASRRSFQRTSRSDGQRRRIVLIIALIKNAFCRKFRQSEFLAQACVFFQC